MNFLRSRRESKDLKTASIEVVCFFEEFKTAMGEIVSKASASITGYETQSIPADRRDMCKFASKDEDGYQRISRVLKRWAVMLQSPQPPEQRLGDTVTMNVGKNMGQMTGNLHGDNHVTFNYTLSS
ncbi:hypothetical protein MferCBS31731_005822 [Microsporum ferrugineum]